MCCYEDVHSIKQPILVQHRLELCATCEKLTTMMKNQSNKKLCLIENDKKKKIQHCMQY